MNINEVIEIGRLVRDPDLKYATNGSAIMDFSIAVNHRKKQGQDTEDVSYFNCKAFGKLAESLKPYMQKGKQVGIAGYLKQERWTTQDGTKRDRVVINCDEIELLGGNQNHNTSSDPYNYD